MLTDIRNGKMNGKIVWVCHYNRPDLAKKPLRNVPPTRVIVRNNDELPKKKNVYYSDSFFSPLNKNDEPTAKIIVPFDNTGYRSFPGNPLHIFDNQKDCEQAWNDDVIEVTVRLNERIANIVNELQDELSATTKLLK